MAVPYYIGARAIADRLGYKSTKTIIRLAYKQGLPIHKRSVPTKTGRVLKYAISESAITAWELVRGQRECDRLRVKAETSNWM